MKYIKGFDALRAVSILMVITTHLGFYKLMPDNEFIKTRFWNLISGSTGVNIFFTLSGFLITLILIREKKTTGRISFKNFYVRRFLRLLPPLIILYLSIGLLMSLGLVKTSFVGLFLSIIYLYNFIPNKFYTGELGHTWSLALEEQFYLIGPFIINYLKGKKIILISSVVVILCVVGTYVLPTIFINYKGNAILIKDLFRVERWFIPAVAPILIGVILATLVLEYETRISKIVAHNKIILILGFSLFLSPLYIPEPIINITSVLLAIGIGFILVWILFNQQSRICKVLEFKPLAYIGKISYGLYVYQGLFLGTGPGGKLSIQQFPLNIILTFVIAIISFELIEKKALKLKSRFR